MQGKKLWQGAFDGAELEIVEFNSKENIELDKLLAKYDIYGSIAHIQMLMKQKIISQEEARSIRETLGQIHDKITQNQFELLGDLEDVHTNVEVMASNISPESKKMHTARSRNDQILLDMRLYLRDEVLKIALETIELQKSYCTLSKEQEGIMVGYTHTRVAQPITVSFWCDAQVESLKRDIDRLRECYQRININPLGAGAIAGSSWHIDRNYSAKLLGFEKIEENELDAISSRGEIEAELLSNLAILGTKLSGIAEELIWLSQKELIKIPDKFCTGSSMMPNKKNPDVLELIRARSVRVQSNLVHVLGVKKGLISGYHSDMQETKYAVMMGIKTTKECLKMLRTIIRELKFDQKRIETELKGGYSQATEIADAIAKKGISFREAHAIVGKLVNECREKEVTLDNATRITQLTQTEWDDALSLDRKRLKKEIKIEEEREKWVKIEMEKIEKIYLKLCQ